MTAKQDNNMAITPYLFFGGSCEEALEFYRKNLDAKIDAVMHFKENPEGCSEGMIPKGFENKIMHSSFRLRGTTIMASDGMHEGANFQGFSLSLSVKDEADANKVFNALSDGGKIQMPLSKTFYSPCFGMLTDRFGISWMVIVPGEI